MKYSSIRYTEICCPYSGLLIGAQLVQDHLKEMFSVIYTPTEGEAIQNYSRLFRRPGGCFLNIEDQDRIEDNIDQWGNPEDIDVIVVSDGEQVSQLPPSNLKLFLTNTTDSWHRRSGRWRNTYQRCEADYLHSMCRHSPFTDLARSIRLWN